MTSRPLYLGIDLGTTNSAAAVFDGEKVTLIRNAQGSTITPSVVRMDAKGHVTVGAKARRFLETDPANTRAEFKRLMGTAQQIDFAAAKASRRPEELGAEVLKSLRADVKDQLGFEPVRAVISVPALFELPQSSATSEAARLAGFEKVELIQEPVASALAAGWTAEESDGYWLVYDLGGGTFDASLLETREGHLRVVGHDGDNFLGGRDVDQAIVDWVLQELSASSGVQLTRGDAANAEAIRKLKHAAEEAKIELARARETSITIPALMQKDGNAIDVDLTLDRETLERLAAPLVDRSVEVCQRLLKAHRVDARNLHKVVLVGGPTAMPFLRTRVGAALGGQVVEGLDPMTLVAQGAAIYAATSNLPARESAAAEERAHRLWLQYPAMSSDLMPHVVGKLVTPEADGAPNRIQLVRGDGQWKSESVEIDAEGAFVVGVELLPRASSVFEIIAERDGVNVPVHPASISMVQGLTISDPPLSRSIGVALANNTVRVYFEKGAPLPARRTFVHHTVESIARAAEGFALRIPIVQGELEQAHLCRLVGSLEIPASGVNASLPAGSNVELTLELDRGGRLTARALVPSLNQVFERVAHLLVPNADAEALVGSVQTLRERAEALRGDALQQGATRALKKLTDVDRGLKEAQRDVEAARGGDADAGQKARRTLQELDAMLEEVESEKRWPELEDQARKRVAYASSWVSQFGTDIEKRLLDDVARGIQRARDDRDATELQRQMRLARDLGDASFFRHPQAWVWMFEDAASEVDTATDLPKARKLVEDGRKAADRGDSAALRPIVEKLWRLLPADVQTRRMGHGSGVR